MLNYSNKLIGIDNLGFENSLSKIKYFNISELSESSDIESTLDDLNESYKSDNYDELLNLKSQISDKMHIIRKRRNNSLDSLNKVLNIYSSTSASVKRDLSKF